MRIRYLALVTLVLVPSAMAQTPPIKYGSESVTVIESLVCGPTRTTCAADAAVPGVVVFDRLDVTVADPAAWPGNRTFTFHVATGAGEPIVRAARNEFQREVSESLVNATAGAHAGFQAWRIDLASVYPTVMAGDKISVQLQYTLATTTYVHWHAYAPETASYFVAPLPGRVPDASGLEGLRAAGERYHAFSNDVRSGDQFQVRFVDAPPAPGTLRDLNTQLWAIGGLVVGFLLAAYGSRRGWFGGQRARKFEKGGEMESAVLLEARRRTLMAALKELEVAHDAKEIPDAAYAPLKEEYKAQAVRVMRTLDEKREGSP